MKSGKEVIEMSKRSRSAKTGKFVTAAYANKHPSTTVTETRKVKTAKSADK
jgi:hypothetical protein